MSATRISGFDSDNIFKFLYMRRLCGSRLHIMWFLGANYLLLPRCICEHDMRVRARQAKGLPRLLDFGVKLNSNVMPTAISCV